MNKLKLKLLSSKVVIVILGVLLIGSIAWAYTSQHNVEFSGDYHYHEAVQPMTAIEEREEIKEREESMAGSLQFANPDFPDYLQIKEDTQFRDSGTMIEADGEFQTSFQNSTGKDLFIELAYVYVDGTASSSYVLDIATSSAATLTYNSNPVSKIVDSATIATGTVDKVFDSIKDAGTNGENVVVVQPDDYVNFMISSKDWINGNCDNTSVACENASSTKRGVGLEWFVKGTYRETPHY